MKKKPGSATDPLRQRAESMVAASRSMLPHADAQKLIQELEIHQIELELQNEELRKTRLEAETNLERYTELYDFSPVGYLTLTPEGLICEANLTVATLLGMERGKLVGQRLGRLVSDLPSFNSFLEKVFRRPVKESCEVMVSGTGTARRMVRIDALAAESGQVCRAILTDISERRLMQERLDRFIKFSMDQVNQAAYLIGPDARIEDVNETACRMLGYGREELIGMAFWKIGPNLQQESWPAHRQEIRAQRTLRYESVHQGKLGQRFPVEVDVTFLDFNGQGHTCVLARDITEQKDAEAALKKSQSQLRLFIEQAPISIAMLDRSLNYIATSARWIAEYGRGHRNVIGCNHYEIHSDVSEEWKKVHRDALAGAFLKNDEDMWIHADGTKQWLRWAVYPWTDESGDTGGIIISAEDITAHKLAEDALRESEQRLTGLVNSAMDAIIAVDANQRIVLFNPAAERMFGFSASKIINRPLDCLLPRAARNAHADHIRAFGDTGVTSRNMGALGAINGLRHNGVEFPIEASISQIDLPSGKVYTAILRDISQRKQAEESLRSSEAQFRAVFEASSVGMCQADPVSGRLLKVNRRFCEMTGYSKEDLSNRPFADITHPDDRRVNLQEFARLVRGEVPEYRSEKRYVCKDGSIIWADVTVNLIHDLNLKPLRTLAVVQDITTKKLAEQALIEADQRKDEFLALLAHELRNPMAVTATAAYLLQNKGLTDPEMCRWAATTITNQTELLKRLVDDLLEVQRVSRGRIALIKTRLDLGQLIDRVVKEREALIERRQQHLTYSQPARPVWIDGDPARMTQVIINLLDNASKFTPKDGQIALSLDRDGDEAVIRVRDNGRGIPPQLLPHIFEIFTQGQVSIARDDGGLGLGLALVKGLVELHGGRVTAASEGPNKGAEFTLRLPALAREDPPPPDSIAPKEVVARKRHILIADDNAIAAEGLTRVLQDAGHEVRVALDGAQALAAAKAARPEIAIVDIGLPVMDGYQLARRLKTLPGASHLLLIALTGYGQEKDRMQSKEAGFGHHLVKPADLKQLLEIIDAWSPEEHA
ncbi:MAG: PAS domain S-box protein [Thiobacillaceae bacterium]